MNCIKCGNNTGAEWKTLCWTCWKARPVEEVRAQRQAKLDRKIARLEARANRFDAVGEQKTAELKSYHGDIAFFTQPAKANSSFGRYRERIMNRYMAGAGLHSEAQELREKAEWLRKTGARVKGDAERERQKEREAADKVFTVGSRVYDYCFGDGVITRVNKKTYTIKFDRSGSTYSRDKSYIKIN